MPGFHKDHSAVDLEQQAALIQRLAQLAMQTAAARSAADRPIVQYRVKALAPFMQDAVYVTDDMGVEKRFFPDRSSIDTARALRDLMYVSGSGTWFSAVITVDSAGQVNADFDFDGEPQWSRPIEPVFYAQDLDRYPRDLSNMPKWLSARVGEVSRSD